MRHRLGLPEAFLFWKVLPCCLCLFHIWSINGLQQGTMGREEDARQRQLLMWPLHLHSYVSGNSACGPLAPKLNLQRPRRDGRPEGRWLRQSWCCIAVSSSWIQSSPADCQQPLKLEQRGKRGKKWGGKMKIDFSHVGTVGRLTNGEVTLKDLGLTVWHSSSCHHQFLYSCLVFLT